MKLLIHVVLATCKISTNENRSFPFLKRFNITLLIGQNPMLYFSLYNIFLFVTRVFLENRGPWNTVFLKIFFYLKRKFYHFATIFFHSNLSFSVLLLLKQDKVFWALTVWWRMLRVQSDPPPSSPYSQTGNTLTTFKHERGFQKQNYTIPWAWPWFHTHLFCHEIFLFSLFIWILKFIVYR